jgi:hypothetical protein
MLLGALQLLICSGKLKFELYFHIQCSLMCRAYRHPQSSSVYISLVFSSNKLLYQPLATNYHRTFETLASIVYTTPKHIDFEPTIRIDFEPTKHINFEPTSTMCSTDAILYTECSTEAILYTECGHHRPVTPCFLAQRTGYWKCPLTPYPPVIATVRQVTGRCRPNCGSGW